MADKLRWGILGAGHIASRFAGDLHHSLSGELTAVASRDANRARALASGHRNVQHFGDYGVMARSDDVDAVYIATPNALHTEHALLAIEAGKHVLCEKPLAINASDAEAMTSAARSAGVVLMEGVWTGFLPTMIKARHLIGDGELGEIRSYTATLGFPRAFAKGDPITDPDLGGGAINDLAIYPLWIAQLLFGPGTIAGHSKRTNRNGSVRSSTAIILHESDGDAILGSVSVAHDTLLGNEFIVSGSKKRLTIGAPFISAPNMVTTPCKWATPSHTDKVTRTRGIRDRSPTAKTLIAWAKGASTFFKSSMIRPYPGFGLQFQADHLASTVQREQRESEIATHAMSVHVAGQLEALTKA